MIALAFSFLPRRGGVESVVLSVGGWSVIGLNFYWGVGARSGGTWRVGVYSSLRSYKRLNFYCETLITFHPNVGECAAGVL